MVVNVSQVKHISPFRYPGGKTWLVPWMRDALRATGGVETFVEPFLGGGSVGLMAVHEGLCQKAVFCEADPAVASVWEAMLGDTVVVDDLCNRISRIAVTPESVSAALAAAEPGLAGRAFQVLLRNRTQRGGILAPGAGAIKKGDGGKGIAARWYPETLVRRIRLIHGLRDRIEFMQGDALALLPRFLKDVGAFCFIDPPYTAGGKRAGARLYAHSQVDHAALFEIAGRLPGWAVMTYDDCAEVRSLARGAGMRVTSVAMKNTHHTLMQEALVLNRVADGLRPQAV